MNILLAVHHYPPLHTMGAEQRAQRTARALIARGHNVRVLCVERIDQGNEHGLSFRDEIVDGVPVRRMSFNLSRTPDPIRFEYDNPWIGDLARAMMVEFKTDLLHLISGYLITGSVLREAHALGIPSVISLTDFWFLCQRISFLRSDGSLSTLPLDPRRCARCVAEEKRRYSWPAKLAPGVMRWWWQHERKRTSILHSRMAAQQRNLALASTLISPSRFLRDVFVDNGCDPGKIIFMRQGRDFSGLDRQATTKTPGATLRIGVLGQVIHVKGVHVAVAAMAHLRDKPVTLHIHGGSNDSEYYQSVQRTAALDSRITLHGAYTASNLTTVLRSVDMLLIPSIWYENSPNVILEAFAHRTPVLASNLGGMAELVSHNVDGLTFAAGDAEDLARQIERVIDNPALLEQFGANIPPVRTVAQEMDELEAIYRRHTDAH